MMHLGPRVGALVDGQLSPADEERAWAHVHTCPTCRAAVEREGWVKRQLACLSLADAGPAPDRLKGSLCSPGAFAAYPDFVRNDDRGRRLGGLAAIGAGTVGAAMFGVIALSAAPAEAPVMERRGPVSSLINSPAANPGPLSKRNQDAADTIRQVADALRMGL